MSGLLQSKACPGYPVGTCGKRILLPVTEEEASAYMDGAKIQVCLANYNADIRERFLSGYCPTCWRKAFGADDVSSSAPRSGDSVQ